MGGWFDILAIIGTVLGIVVNVATIYGFLAKKGIGPWKTLGGRLLALGLFLAGILGFYLVLGLLVVIFGSWSPSEVVRCVASTSVPACGSDSPLATWLIRGLALLIAIFSSLMVFKTVYED